MRNRGNISMRAIVMSGLVAGTMALGGGAFALDPTEQWSHAPLDPAGTSSGQAQRDGVEQFGKGVLVDPRYPMTARVPPLDPAGTQTGQAQRAPVESIAPGERVDPLYPMEERIPPLDPAGTQTGQAQRGE